MRGHISPIQQKCYYFLTVIQEIKSDTFYVKYQQIVQRFYLTWEICLSSWVTHSPGHRSRTSHFFLWRPYANQHRQRKGCPWGAPWRLALWRRQTDGGAACCGDIAASWGRDLVLQHSVMVFCDINLCYYNLVTASLASTVSCTVTSLSLQCARVECDWFHTTGCMRSVSCHVPPVGKGHYSRFGGIWAMVLKCEAALQPEQRLDVGGAQSLESCDRVKVVCWVSFQY